MVSPVPPLGLFHTGSPSHCAAAGVARNADNATVNAARIDTPSGEVGGGREGWRRLWSQRENLPNLHQPPPTSITCFSSVHPHGADRHAGERPVAQAAGDARVSGGLGDRPLTGVSIGAVWEIGRAHV